MCFLFHKWSKWSAPFDSVVEHVVSSFGDLARSDALVQERTCQRCGLRESHVVRYSKSGLTKNAPDGSKATLDEQVQGMIVDSIWGGGK